MCYNSRMDLKEIRNKIKLIDKNIEYYTKVYSSESKKVKELKEKRDNYIKMLESSK